MRNDVMIEVLSGFARELGPCPLMVRNRWMAIVELGESGHLAPYKAENGQFGYTVTDLGRAALAAADVKRKARNSRARVSRRVLSDVLDSIGVKAVRGARGGRYFE